MKKEEGNFHHKNFSYIKFSLSLQFSFCRNTVYFVLGACLFHYCPSYLQRINILICSITWTPQTECSRIAGQHNLLQQNVSSRCLTRIESLSVQLSPMLLRRANRGRGGKWLFFFYESWKGKVLLWKQKPFTTLAWDWGVDISRTGIFIERKCFQWIWLILHKSQSQ